MDAEIKEEDVVQALQPLESPKESKKAFFPMSYSREFAYW